LTNLSSQNGRKHHIRNGKHLVHPVMSYSRIKDRAGTLDTYCLAVPEIPSHGMTGKTLWTIPIMMILIVVALPPKLSALIDGAA